MLSKTDDAPRVALVVGGSGALGGAVARELARAGCRVLVGYATREDAASREVENIVAAGGLAEPLRIDLAASDTTGSEAVLEGVRKRYGRVDILVNAVGVNREAPAAGMDDDAWRVVLDANLTGAFRVSRAAAAGMVAARWGRMIHLSSVAAVFGGRGQIGYAASKAGLESMVRVLALELGRKGVTVNAIRPGVITSPMTERLRAEHGDEILARIAARRFGRPEDVAAAVAFLASDAAGYVNGQVLAVDGGLGLG